MQHQHREHRSARPHVARAGRALRGDRGAAALEFAIVLPVLVLVIFGLIDFGRLLTAQIGVTAASREGVRALALGRTQAQASTVVQASSPKLSSLASLGKTTSLTVSQVSACPTTPGPTSMASLTVSTNFSWVAPVSILSISADRTVASTSQMLCVG